MATINTDPNKEVLDSIDSMFNRIQMVSPFNEMGGINSVSVPAEMEPQNGQIQPVGYLEDDSVTEETIAPGAVTPEALDPTPPAAPTGLALTSALVPSPDGSLVLRLTASLSQPADTDLYASYVQVTAEESSPGTADWTRPMLIAIGADDDEGSIEGVAGNTLYYARAYAVDVIGNRSTMTAEATHTTAADTEAPEVPQGFAVVAGFEGLLASWVAGTAADLAFNQLRVAVDDGSGTAPNTDEWEYFSVRTNVAWIGDLLPDVLYWAQVRAVDRSGNVVTSAEDDTAVNYATDLTAGWTDLASGTPSLIGAADIAANSISAVHIQTGSLNADDIGAGTLTIKPEDGFAEGIRVLDADGVIIGEWDENGIKISNPDDTSQYVLLDAGQVSFNDGTGEVAALTADGLNASAINFGSAPGGHNIILNSSFELADFVAAATQFAFTDFNQWAAAQRFTAPDNIADGGAVTSLSMTSAGF